MKINCAFCGKTFNVNPSDLKRNRRFCSLTCYHQSEKTRVPYWSKKNRIKKICKGCGKSFEVIPCKIYSKYCNKKCYLDNKPNITRFHIESKGKTIEELYGENYAKNMRRVWSKKRKGRIFTKQHKLNLAKNKVEYYKKIFPKIKKICLICKKAFIVNYGKRGRKFCNRRCFYISRKR